MILGEGDNHLGLLEAMDEEGLFRFDREDDFFVVGARIEPWERKGRLDAY